jgi:hypothetical protein
MSTPTEAHYDLRRQVIFSDPDQGTQLIADSEARAIAKQVEALAILTLRWDKVEKEQDQLRARTERAEAELAKERARLDAGTILLTVAGERVWHCGVNLRAAIDAAIKEDAK